jgi:uncharacterized protein
MIHYNTLLRDIDRSLARLESDRMVDYRSLFLSAGQKPAHAAVRTWVRGFWTATGLAPETWSALVEDERTKTIIAPFVGFFEIGKIEPHEIPDDIDDRLNEDAALIPRMILVLRKLARIAKPPAARHRSLAEAKSAATIRGPAAQARNTNAVVVARDCKSH